jgi:hypothetical protein
MTMNRREGGLTSYAAMVRSPGGVSGQGVVLERVKGVK